MSLVTPASSQPCSRRASSGPLMSCTAFGRSGSASQAPSALSSSGLSSAGITNPADPSGAARARPVSTPTPRPHVPRNANPTRPLACSSSQAATSSTPSRCTARSKPSSASASGASTLENSRSRNTRNCRLSNSECTSSRSHWPRSRSSTPRSSATSRTSSVSWRLRMTLARFSRRASPTLPLTVSTPATSASKLPNSRIHLAAVFSPTPGMPGRLSDGSPRRAAKSGYWAGVRSYLDRTSSGVNRVRSLTPRRG